MSKSGKLMPNLDEKSTKLLNLTVLQRIDRFVEEILITAAHVVLYEFNIDTCQWSRKDVEGSLFIVKRNTRPQYQFIVMNRRRSDNLVENLSGDFEYEVQVPYLLYQNAAQEVNGIWFFYAHECEEVADLFSRILNAHPRVPTKSKASPTEREFEELEAASTLTVLDGSLERSSSATANVADVPEYRSFVNFFNTGTAPHVANPRQPYHCFPTVVSAHSQSITLPTSPPAQALTSSTSSPVMSILEKSESNTAMKHATDLVKPSSFFAPPPSSPLLMPPIISSLPTASPVNSPANLQRPVGAPLLRPFPPPIPPTSLTPTSVATSNYGPTISKDKVREALQLLVQDNQFIDIIYQAVRDVHKS